MAFSDGSMSSCSSVGRNIPQVAHGLGQLIGGPGSGGLGPVLEALLHAFDGAGIQELGHLLLGEDLLQDLTVQAQQVGPAVATHLVQGVFRLDEHAVGEGRRRLHLAEEELDMAHEQLADEAAKKAELKKMESELQKRYREDPSYKKMRRNSLDLQYGDLFEELNLSPEKLEEFKDLLVDLQTEFSDFYTEMQEVTPSEEKRAEFEQRSKELQENRETKIKEFLGDNNYEKYQEYQGTWLYKYNVTNFMATLESGEELTEFIKSNN